ISPILATGTKHLVERHRPPTAERLGMTSFSFPSGHSLGVAANYGVLALVLARMTTGQKRRLFYLVCGGAVILAVGASRLYLGVPYVSDVIGGWSAGLALACVGLWVEMRWSGALTRLPAGKHEGPPPELLPFPVEPMLAPALQLARGDND